MWWPEAPPAPIRVTNGAAPSLRVGAALGARWTSAARRAPRQLTGSPPSPGGMRRRYDRGRDRIRGRGDRRRRRGGAQPCGGGGGAQPRGGGGGAQPGDGGGGGGRPTRRRRRTPEAATWMGRSRVGDRRAGPRRRQPTPWPPGVAPSTPQHEQHQGEQGQEQSEHGAHPHQALVGRPVDGVDRLLSRGAGVVRLCARARRWPS